MERLTKRTALGSLIQKGEVSTREMIDKLGAYEDAEEQGLLLRLPCKVGDIVYKLWYEPCHFGETYPDAYGCSGCEDECDLKRKIFEFTVPSTEWILQNMKNFGKCVWFLTRVEAEKALAEMGV